MMPKEELAGWTKVVHHSLDEALILAGPFPWDEDGNYYLLVTIDPFSKWVETHAMPSQHS